MEQRMTIGRRRLLSAGIGVLGAAAFPALAATGVERRLQVLNLHTGEKLKATFFEQGRYLPDALAAFDHVLRDHRTGEARRIAPGLLDLVSRLGAQFGSDREIQVISGYRSPATNGALHRASSGVATHSLHMEGEAMDIRIAGVDLSRLRDAALADRTGGVGYYPSSRFVHVDVGRVRRWQGS
jgi:uncharacterized protein YcbK (DUF882 family)